MTAAPEIPADVMAAAREVLEGWSNPGSAPVPLEVAIARAILAERQRCVEAACDVILSADSSVAPYVVAGASMVLAKIQGHNT